MNIALVGSSGYLGNKLLIGLESKGYNTLSIIKDKKLENIKNYLYVDDEYLYDKINKFAPDFIIYSVAAYENSLNNYSDIFKANFLLPMDFLNKMNIKNFIYIGTSLDKYTNQYSLSKYQFSEYGKYYADNYNINFINIKLENFYGKDEPNGRFLSTIINKLKNNEDINLTEGTQIRDFIYIYDAVNGILKIVESNLKGYTDISLGSGEGITIRELVEYLSIVLESKSKLNFGAIPFRKNEHSGFADMTKMKELGFEIDSNIKKSILEHMI